MGKTKATYSIFSYVVVCNNKLTGNGASVHIRSGNQKKQRDNKYQTY